MPTDLKARPRRGRRMVTILAIAGRVLPVAQAFLMASATTMTLMILVQLEIDSWSCVGGPPPAVLAAAPR